MKEATDRPAAWRQFVAVAEELHFGRAAARLHMTQPPRDPGHRAARAHAGRALFDRTRAACADAAGEALLPEVRELLARARRCRRGPAPRPRARSGACGWPSCRPSASSRCRAGCGTSARACPEVALELVEATGDVQLEALRARRDRCRPDAAFAGLRAAGARAPGAWPRAAGAGVARTHPLAGAPTLTLARVLAEPLVIFPRRIVPSLHDAIFALYHAAGRVPQVAQEAIQMQTIVNLVWGGLGVAWVPRERARSSSGRAWSTAPRRVRAARAGATARCRCRPAKPAWSGRPRRQPGAGALRAAFMPAQRMRHPAQLTASAARARGALVHNTPDAHVPADRPGRAAARAHRHPLVWPDLPGRLRALFFPGHAAPAPRALSLDHRPRRLDAARTSRTSCSSA